jgi:PPM family protein phosphatase
MGIDIGLAQHIGQRKRQEDSMAVLQICPDPHQLLMVLADGMGGHQAGDVASRVTVATVLSHMIEAGVSSTPDLRDAVVCANQSLARLQTDDPTIEGMGSTCVAATLGADGLQWVSVGDSLLFLLRDGQLRRLNADHSMAPVLARMVDAGEIDPAEAAEHPDRHALMSALTGNTLRLVDAPDVPLPLQAGDLVLMASDGVLALSLPKIQDILLASRHLGAREVAQHMLEQVLSQAVPEQDNVSIIIIEKLGTSPTVVEPQRRALSGVAMLGLALGLALVVLILLVAIGQRVSAAGGLVP